MTYADLIKALSFHSLPPTLGDCERAALHCCSSRCRGRSDSEHAAHSHGINVYSPPPFSSQPVGGEMRQAHGMSSVSCLQLSEHNLYLLSTVENVFTWSQLISKFLDGEHM